MQWHAFEHFARLEDVPCLHPSDPKLRFPYFAESLSDLQVKLCGSSQPATLTARSVALADEQCPHGQAIADVCHIGTAVDYVASLDLRRCTVHFTLDVDSAQIYGPLKMVLPRLSSMAFSSVAVHGDAAQRLVLRSRHMVRDASGRSSKLSDACVLSVGELDRLIPAFLIAPYPEYLKKPNRLAVSRMFSATWKFAYASLADLFGHSSDIAFEGTKACDTGHMSVCDQKFCSLVHDALSATAAEHPAADGSVPNGVDSDGNSVWLDARPVVQFMVENCLLYLDFGNGLKMSVSKDLEPFASRMRTYIDDPDGQFCFVDVGFHLRLLQDGRPLVRFNLFSMDHTSCIELNSGAYRGSSVVCSSSASTRE